MSFAIGQRWISETENNLGLGMITALDFRSVTLHFPATDETRIYAVAQAPLTRIALNKGEQLHHQTGWQGEVLDVQEMNGLLFYLVKNAQGEDIIVNEKELSPIISFSQAKDRLFSSQIDRSEHFALRYQTLLHQQAQFQSPLRGLRGNRAGLIPHQLHIAQEVGNRINPRVLLADEVGLGKTIEAGMILQNQLFAEKVQRVLIIVPETLQHQWLVEMLRRFNLHFSLFDEERCEDFAEQVINPFSTESLIICALDWLKAHPHRVQQAIEAEFDCLIVDEAHHLAWSENAPSTTYLLVEQLANAIPSVLLLTATPEQLGLESHFARLRLLDSERFYDYQAFLKEQENYQPVADAVQSLLSEKPLSAVEKNHISDLLHEQDVEPLFKALACHNDDEKQAARQELIQNLIDRHGTSRILFRNTRQGVKGFPHRVYHQITIDAAEVDEKIHWLIDFLKSHRNEKILVICKTAQTAIQLEQILREKESIDNYIQNDGVVLAICGGFQLLGQYYVEASGKRIEGLGVMGHYTLNQTNNRFIGDIKIHNEEFDETYYGFENHQGRTFLSDDQKPLGQVIYGNGNNEEKVGEGVHYKNVFGSYFHGPILSRNANLAYRLVTTALKKKYGQDIQLPAYEDILGQEIAEEYSDVKSKADFTSTKEK